MYEEGTEDFRAIGCARLLTPARANSERSTKSAMAHWHVSCATHPRERNRRKDGSDELPTNSGEMEIWAMTTDERDILELLKEELDFIESGGYGRSVRTPWQNKSTFQDSLSCINYGYPYRAHPCSECHLLDFVTPEHRTEAIPCHFIPLNTDGETIEDLELQDNQAKLEREVGTWLRERIKQIEEERANTARTAA
jgi:hypothetical protein